MVTTLLDRTRYPRKKLAALYGRRWNVETNLNHLKTSLGMNVLAAEKPETVIKEIWAHALAYNLVRTVMWEAGRRHGIDPLRLSLSDAVKEICSHRCFALLGSARRWITRLLRKVASHRIPHRPGRHEPRVRKRRPKEYPLMTQPRPVLRRPIMQAS
ncbi:MAG TPA: transposase [Phycisphaerae bacterium]|nr:transposase [Phycisphaerae bacterium]